MADIFSVVNTSEIGEGIVGELLPPILDKISPLITIFKAVGIAVFVYIIFLIIKAFLGWRTASKIRKIDKNVAEINKKLDLLVKKKSELHDKERTEKKRKLKGFFSVFKKKRK